MIYVDLRNNLLRTSSDKRQPLRQILMRCARGNEGRYVAEHFQFPQNVSIEYWKKWLQGKVKIKLMRTGVWNEETSKYDSFDTYEECGGDNGNVGFKPKVKQQKQGSDLKINQLVLYRSDYYGVVNDKVMSKMSDDDITVDIEKTEFYTVIYQCQSVCIWAVSDVYQDLHIKRDLENNYK